MNVQLNRSVEGRINRISIAICPYGFLCDNNVRSRKQHGYRRHDSEDGKYYQTQPI